MLQVDGAPADKEGTAGKKETADKANKESAAGK